MWKFFQFLIISMSQTQPGPALRHKKYWRNSVLHRHTSTQTQNSHYDAKATFKFHTADCVYLRSVRGWHVSGVGPGLSSSLTEVKLHPRQLDSRDTKYISRGTPVRRRTHSEKRSTRVLCWAGQCSLTMEYKLKLFRKDSKFVVRKEHFKDRRKQ